MIVVDESQPDPLSKFKSAAASSGQWPDSATQGLPGNIPLDPFQDSNVAQDPPYQDPPPNFTVYVPSYFTHSDGSVISHDAHLNEDGEALYRFLLSQSSTHPTFHLHIRGTHPETKVRFSNSGSSQQRLNNRLRTETYTEIATDFDFRIDLTPNILTQPTAIQWSVRDDEPAYRGQMYQQIESPSDLIGVLSKSSVRRKDLKKYKALCKDRADLGKPPWASTSLSPPQIATQLQSSRTVRQWCDDYCASDKVLKEFVYTKVVYGWDFRKLTSAINSLIVNEAGYTGDLQINFTPEPKASDLIIVRPTTELSRALSNPWIKFFLIITLIYPFIWLFKRFHDKGGGVWKVCGSGYPLKVVRPVPRQEELLVDVGTSSSPRTTDDPAGEREGVWFKRWELNIRRAVDQKVRSPVPLAIGRSPNPDAAHLDGYNGV